MGSKNPTVHQEKLEGGNALWGLTRCKKSTPDGATNWLLTQTLARASLSAICAIQSLACSTTTACGLHEEMMLGSGSEQMLSSFFSHHYVMYKTADFFEKNECQIIFPREMSVSINKSLVFASEMAPGVGYSNIVFSTFCPVGNVNFHTL